MNTNQTKQNEKVYTHTHTGGNESKVKDVGQEVEQRMREVMTKITVARKALNQMSYEFNRSPNVVTALYDTIDDMLRAADSLIERSRVNLQSAVSYQQKEREA